MSSAASPNAASPFQYEYMLLFHTTIIWVFTLTLIGFALGLFMLLVSLDAVIAKVTGGIVLFALLIMGVPFGYAEYYTVKQKVRLRTSLAPANTTM